MAGAKTLAQIFAYLPGKHRRKRVRVPVPVRVRMSVCPLNICRLTYKYFIALQLQIYV